MQHKEKIKLLEIMFYQRLGNVCINDKLKRKKKNWSIGLGTHLVDKLIHIYIAFGWKEIGDLRILYVVRR